MECQNENQQHQKQKQISNQVSLQILTRTPNGQVYYGDLKNIFASLIYCLDLKDVSNKKPNSSIIKFNFKKSYPYSFSIDNAIKVMTNLSINIQYHVTLTVLSYKIKPDFAYELLQLFYTANFLHCPDDKTLKKINSHKLILQPTPKGVAILYQFCSKMGIANVIQLNLPDILQSNFNSMKLMEFERHSRTDMIINNTHSNKLLFIKIMGPSCNIWSSKNGPDMITDIGSVLVSKKKDEDQIHGIDFQSSNPLENDLVFHEYLKQRQKEAEIAKQTKQVNTNENDVKQSSIREKPQISPFYHRFFTNPESDSHIQYYVSTCGLRFFKEKNIHNKVFHNCFSGKAMIQYLMDCTDLANQREAIKVATNFLKLKLIQFEYTKDNNLEVFNGSKDSLYTLTNEGKKLVKWTKPSKQQVSLSSNSSVTEALQTPSELTLEKIIKDPGLKYLFKQFMEENVCVENLNVYDEIIDFQKKMKILKKMLTLKDKEKRKYLEELKSDGIFKQYIADKVQTNALTYKKLTIYTAMNKLSEYCLSKVYTIFAMYISEDAPNEINIDSELKFKITDLVQSEGNFNSPYMNFPELKSKIMFNLNSSDSDVSKSNHSLSDVESTSSLSKINSNDASIDTATIKQVKPVKELTLNLKHLRNVEPAEYSPTEAIFGPKLKFLEKILVLYDEIKVKAYRMMETDSFSKFLKSKKFKENYYAL